MDLDRGSSKMIKLLFEYDVCELNNFPQGALDFK